ncbi:hypothetical protein BD413DRAFT_585377 [Trametes elegans]|nr:hypothetical protein BD413DRAFT_585377 [Trametes elegans]
MPMRHAQRKHIIQSLNSLLYQLHTISFLLSPRLWAYFCRVLVQFQFVRPREIDSQRSLRFWFFCILSSNAPALYAHAAKNPASGRTLILDFVGNNGVPPRALLLFLDFAIMFFQAILTAVAYETSLTRDMPADTPDPLQPVPIPSTPISPLPIDDTDVKPLDSALHEDGTEYIIDLRLRPLLQRLRHPPSVPPPPQPRISEDLLPLPNTTSFQLAQSLRLLRASARRRERPVVQTNGSRRNSASRDRGPDGRNRDSPEETRRLPGGMASDSEE